MRPHLLGAASYFFVALTDDTANVWQTLEIERPKLLPFLADPSRLSRAGKFFRHARQFLNAKRRFEFQNRNCQAVRTGLQVEYTNVGLTTSLRGGLTLMLRKESGSREAAQEYRPRLSPVAH